jgi:hypothetical protein
MINSINPYGNLGAVNFGGYNALKNPAGSTGVSPYSNYGTDGFSASRELQRGGFMNGMPPLTNTNFLTNMPTPVNNTMPNTENPSKGIWSAMGASVVGNLLNRLIDRLFGGGGNGGNGGGGEVDDGGGYDDGGFDDQNVDDQNFDDQNFDNQNVDNNQYDDQQINAANDTQTE